VDDQALVRAGVRALLQTACDVEVIGEAADGRVAVRLVERLRPDVVLMDIRMPQVDGIEATRRILAMAPRTNVLMLAAFAEDDDVYAALNAGAVGFLVKDGEPSDMIDAVRRAACGEPSLAPNVLMRVVQRARLAHDADRSLAARPDANAATLARLTPREREVLTLIGTGLSNADISAALHVGVTTVKTHIVATLSKLGVRNRVQAGVLAHRFGLVDDDFRPVAVGTW
jgi:DNA-binding NarL/FixJ family response regulator